MSSNNKGITKRLLMIALALTVIFAVYNHFNEAKQIEKSNLRQSNSATPVLKNQPCSINNNCNEVDRSSTRIDSSNNFVAPVSAGGVDITETSKSPRLIKLQGENIINIDEFINSDIHQCQINIDEESVLEINLLLEYLSYEKPLYKQRQPINDYLSINIIYTELPENFIETLVYKLQTLLRIYEQSFGLYLRKQNEITLVILEGQKSYEDFIENLHFYNSNSQGLFWTQTNYAFVAFKDKEQAAETALHELGHGINHSLIGMTPRWLNEGLAQLFEAMTITDQDGNIRVSLKRPALNNNHELLDFQHLPYSEDQWSNITLRHDLYFTSHYLLTYLFDQQQGIKIISKLLREESKAPCSVLDKGDYLDVISEGLYDMPTNFDEWIAG